MDGGAMGKRYKKVKGDFVKLAAELSELELWIKTIPSDGNCLFAAFGDQLVGCHSDKTANQLRRNVVEHLRRNKEHYQHFVEDDMPYDEYVNQMSNPGYWGGHVELDCLSSLYKVNILVHQVNGRSYSMQRFDTTRRCLMLAFHEKHYNSVRVTDDDGDGPAKLLSLATVNSGTVAGQGTSHGVVDERVPLITDSRYDVPPPTVGDDNLSDSGQLTILFSPKDEPGPSCLVDPDKSEQLRLEKFENDGTTDVALTTSLGLETFMEGHDRPGAEIEVVLEETPTSHLEIIDNYAFSDPGVLTDEPEDSDSDPDTGAVPSRPLRGNWLPKHSRRSGRILRRSGTCWVKIGQRSDCDKVQTSKGHEESPQDHKGDRNPKIEASTNSHGGHQHQIQRGPSLSRQIRRHKSAPIQVTLQDASQHPMKYDAAEALPRSVCAPGANAKPIEAFKETVPKKLTKRQKKLMAIARKEAERKLQLASRTGASCECRRKKGSTATSQTLADRVIHV
eukprot:GHVN01005903.1.p1 GENE.GHVN01005903.1~~GHVN01005903.1.p1  ORF type:complete len:505 (-),score=50.64 GHVN01005903.1:940-2454(-)